ncbi:MAG: methylmalonyl-CoA epimerase [Chitinophagaceae bacterium]|nr:methylmalonyl-CoA epimerase [Chitinophagaceae bacterium]
MNKIEHIGIAVSDLEASVSLFEKLLNTPCYKKERVDTEGVETAFFRTGESKIELVADTRKAGTMGKFIAKRGEGIHHIAFEVDDIESEIRRLKQQGFQFVKDEPVSGADGKMVCFLHPKSTNGVLIELVADKKKG